MPKAVALEPEVFGEWFPRRRSSSRKGENGRVLVVGGSWLYHGAPVNSSRGAMAAGVDLVYLAVPKTISVPVRSMSADIIVYPLPDAKTTAGSMRRLLKWLPEIDCAVVGPGTAGPASEGLALLVRELRSRGVAVVLDAGALEKEIVAPASGGRAVVTPHAGEFKRLTGVELPRELGARVEPVRKAAKELGVTILQKGRGDVISDGTACFTTATGRAAMTVGGTGDVLAGLVGGLLSLGMDPVRAAAVGSYANGLAGTRAWEEYGNRITATDVGAELRHVMKGFDRGDMA
ncbi:MAG: NAD(P)H-hydrate dehydratase [Nitrososphaerota archaeon]|nr:NAD(P)H-hydrate dehydratase [Nitrososphaerota archaeon]